MRILYCAIDQAVPGTKGGSVHVTAVADGLAALGHEVHVLAAPGRRPFPRGDVRWRAMTPPLGRKELRWMRLPAVRRVVRELQPDVVMERYYNFGGEAIVSGASSGITTVLEVNAPAIDVPGSAKTVVDRLLVVRPMRRWREHLCSLADVIVSPSAAILPPAIPAGRVVRLEWGADTERFTPGASGPVTFERPAGTLAVFAGAFRSWHGAVNLVGAIRELRARGRSDISAVFVGEGPELPAVRAEAAGIPGIVFTGAIDHAMMPACLAAADIGVAPFDLSAHRPLALGFYWSPLKIFEYMAAGLPVVAPSVDRLPDLVTHGREGLLYDPAFPGALATALERLSDPALRLAYGRAARERAVRDYSWAAHCRALEAAIRRAREARLPAGGP
ncbi:MAG TPA: glycosyltransferase [Vicinamibacterales bacterium]|nr:glycosyltransferase [Vicinamibacterales bacterium]